VIGIFSALSPCRTSEHGPVKRAFQRGNSDSLRSDFGATDEADACDGGFLVVRVVGVRGSVDSFSPFRFGKKEKRKNYKITKQVVNQ
jgi:hypothetical protein